MELDLPDGVWDAAMAAQEAVRYVDHPDNQRAVYGMSTYAVRAMLAAAFQAGRQYQEPDYPSDEAMAAIAAACTCPGCMTAGKCIDDPERWDEDDDRNDCASCPSDCQICSGTPDCDCPTHGDECDG